MPSDPKRDAVGQARELFSLIVNRSMNEVPRRVLERRDTEDVEEEITECGVKLATLVRDLQAEWDEAMELLWTIRADLDRLFGEPHEDDRRIEIIEKIDALLARHEGEGE